MSKEIYIMIRIFIKYKILKKLPNPSKFKHNETIVLYL